MDGGVQGDLRVGEIHEPPFAPTASCGTWAPTHLWKYQLSLVSGLRALLPNGDPTAVRVDLDVGSVRRGRRGRCNWRGPLPLAAVPRERQMEKEAGSRELPGSKRRVPEGPNSSPLDGETERSRPHEPRDQHILDGRQVRPALCRWSLSRGGIVFEQRRPRGRRADG